jgi:PAS domain S-box-containing protein
LSKQKTASSTDDRETANPPGFEPGPARLELAVLPLHHGLAKYARLESNQRPLPSQSSALTTELRAFAGGLLAAALLTGGARKSNIDAMPRRVQDVDLWLVDSLVTPASLHDVDGRFIHMNAAAERASGKSNAEMLGQELTVLLPAEVRESVETLFRRAVEHGTPTDFETVFVDGGGHLRGARAQHLPLRDGDTIVGVLILAFDVRRPPSEPIRAMPDPHLTPRQLEILELIAAGLSTTEVARELTLSSETVRNHLRNAFAELGVHTRVEAIVTAQRLGLLAAPALGPHVSEDGVHAG